MVLLLLVTYAAAAVPDAAAQTYYVSSTGDDRNPGISWKQAWKHLQHAADRVLPGDTVVIRRSDKPYAGFRIARSGDVTRPITFKGELSDNPPTISAAIPHTAWTGPDAQGVWRSTAVGKPSHFKENNYFLEKASSPSCDDGRWHWKDNVLYYRPSRGVPADHIVWRDRGIGIHIGDHSWIVLEDLNLLAGMGAGITIDKGSHNTVRRVHAKWYWRGINVRGGSHNLIEQCKVEGNQEGIYLERNSSYNTIRNCRAIHNGNLPYWTSGDRHAIAIGGDVKEAAIANVVDSCEIAYNGGPPETVALIAFHAPRTVFNNNYVHDNYGSAAMVSIGSDSSRITSNRIIKNGSMAVKDGHAGIYALGIWGSRNVTVMHNKVLDNTVSYHSRWPGVHRGPKGGLDIREAGQRHDMRGIVIQDNEISGTRGGPNIYISSVPDTSDIVIDPVPH
jgi:parallel beta-helix repeat protein